MTKQEKRHLAFLIMWLALLVVIMGIDGKDGVFGIVFCLIALASNAYFFIQGTEQNDSPQT